MRDPKVKVVVPFSVDDFPAGIAVGMACKGVNFDGDILRPQLGEQALQIGNTAEVFPANSKECGRVGESITTQNSAKMACSVDA